MTWVHVQQPLEASWADYERVAQALGDEAPEGLVMHLAGEVDGRWRSVSIWESRAAFDRFRDERLMPVVTAALGPQALAGGPPPEEWFEVRHSMQA